MNPNLVIALVVIVALAGVVLLLANRPAAYPVPQTPSPTTPTPTTPTPSPTPTPPQPQAGVPSVRTSSDTVVSNSTAVVTGQVTPNGAQTSYWYEYGITTALGTRTAAQSIGSGFVAIPSPSYITGLSANTHYYYRLSASNAFGTVNGSTHDFTTTSEPPPPRGNAPTTQTAAATAVTRTTANLNGRVNPNGSQSSYWFEYGTTSALGNVTAFESAGSGATSMAVSVSLSGLEPATRYHFRLNAQNQFGTINGAIMTFTTPGPPAPAAPTVETRNATNVGTSTATFNGRINPNGAETTYWFEYSEDSLLGTLTRAATPTQSAGAGTEALTVSADVSGLLDNTNYFYRLIARNAEGTIQGEIKTFRTR